MVFSSELFLFLFLPVVLLIYHAIPQRLTNARNIALLLCSLAFYAWGEPAVVFVMIASIALNYFLAHGIGRYRKRARLFLVLSVALNIGALGYFKYANFIAQNANLLFGSRIASDIALPIGISFYTFQMVSYVTDIYKGNITPQRNAVKWALYISFFPQLIAGPIIRYADIEPQLSTRANDADKFFSGLQRFIVGLSKKVLIANQVAVMADAAFAGSPQFAMAWAGAVCYALQIYFDFSGYSDMAIGLGKMFGFDFRENFNYPYISGTVQEFWRRWHISLSSWFRDYVYIPLGGNRRGAFRTHANLIIVFAVTGLWHGASWNFVIWGLYHGVFLILERGAFGKVLGKLPRAVKWIYTTAVVLFGWVLFRSESMAQAASYIKRMLDFRGGGFQSVLANLNVITIAAVALGIVFSAPVLPALKRKVFGENGLAAGEGLTPIQSAAGWGTAVFCLCLLLASILFLTGSAFNPFLYFRF